MEGPGRPAVSTDARFGTDGWQILGRHVGGPGAADVILRVKVQCAQ